MSDTSRRGFLAIAGVGAAGVAVASVAGAAAVSSAAAPASAAKDDSTELPAGASGSLVAYVNDVQDGRVSVLVGENEVQIRDRELVARLAQAAHTAANQTGA